VRADLEATARPVGSAAFGFFGPTAIGAGLVDANSAVAALALPPVVTISGFTQINPPILNFSANRRATFTCSLDAGSTVPCTSPYTPSAPLADGPHEFTVTATDDAGHSGSATYRFAIPKVPPTLPPVVKFTLHPRKVVKTRKGSVRLKFEFMSSVPNSTFQCKVDKGGFKPCRGAFIASFKVGRHSVVVRAVDPAGTVGKPVTFKFRVQKVAPKHHKHRHHR
jgi:hypothetical protein